jgi:hypothetical protein
MYVKISNVSTKTQLSEALPDASRGLLSTAQKPAFAIAFVLVAQQQM